MPRKKTTKSSKKTKRAPKPTQATAERASNQGGPWEDIYQTNVAKGNLGTLEGETSERAHELVRRRDSRVA